MGRLNTARLKGCGVNHLFDGHNRAGKVTGNPAGWQVCV